MNRRNFIEKTALGAGAIPIFPQYLAGQSRSFAPSETIILAASDVDQKKLARFQGVAERINAEKLNGGKQEVTTFENYRELLERRESHGCSHPEIQSCFSNREHATFLEKFQTCL